MAEKIPDEEVIKHFKKRLLDKIPLKKKRDLRVVAVKPPKTPTGDFVIEELMDVLGNVAIAMDNACVNKLVLEDLFERG